MKTPTARDLSALLAAGALARGSAVRACAATSPWRPTLAAGYRPFVPCKTAVFPGRDPIRLAYVEYLRIEALGP